MGGNFPLSFLKFVQDILGVLATQKFLERGKRNGIFIMFGFPLLLVFS